MVLAPQSADALGRALREGNPPVVARIVEDRAWLDPRTVQPEEEADLLAAVRAAWERMG
jgi:seryl-tRNA(Sec) selenium transferase